MTDRDFILWLDGYLSAIEEVPCSHVPFRYLERIRNNLDHMQEFHQKSLKDKL
jgi:hypothetical protein